MQFDSIPFVIFLTGIIVAYYLIRGGTWKQLLLIGAAVFFITQANLFSLLLISLITVATYFLGIEIEKRRETNSGSLIFLFAVILIIANLFFFKYYNFFNQNLDRIFSLFHATTPLPYIHVLFPLGLSFYTFSVLGYLIDVHVEKVGAERNIIVFLNYIFFFPKLMAGPIERAQHFLPQVREEKKLLWKNFSVGGKLIIWGFFQKLVIADRVSIYVDSIYADPTQHSRVTILVCMVLYTFQIYADFSGYTDIARGIARLFGYVLMQNFRRPLLATSITMFWRRWHISLSSWVNDYIFTPLVLKYRNLGLPGIVLALFISFVIFGIWHGALWTWVLFGLLQGLFLSIELLTTTRRKALYTHFPKKIIKILGLICTFTLITISLVLVRSPSLHSAVIFFSRLTAGGGLSLQNSGMFVFGLLGIAVLILRSILQEFLRKDILKIKSRFFLVRSLPYAALIIVILLIGVFNGGQFIYLRF